MHHSWSLAIALGVLATVPRPANCEDMAPALTPGARIRVMNEETVQELSGNFLSLSNTTLRLEVPEAGPVDVPLRFLSKLEISRGRRSRAGHVGFSLIVGAGIGALGVLISGAGCAEGPAPKPGSFCTKSGFLDALTKWTAIGAGAGLVVGVVSPPPERWNEIAAPRGQSGVARAPGPGLYLSVRF